MTDYTGIIKNLTIPVEKFKDDNNIQPFKWLSDEIYEGKAPLKLNTVQFIVVKILNTKNQSYNLKNKQSFDVYVIGDFRKTFNPVLRVAEAFASFYLEMGILPNIISIPKHILKDNKELLYKLKNGVLIYERR